MLSIVLELDAATVLGPDTGPLLGVVGETVTSGHPVRLERMGRPEIKNFILQDKQFDPVNRDLEIRDLYNAEDAFDLGPTTSAPTAPGSTPTCPSSTGSTAGPTGRRTSRASTR